MLSTSYKSSLSRVKSKVLKSLGFKKKSKHPKNVIETAESIKEAETQSKLLLQLQDEYADFQIRRFPLIASIYPDLKIESYSEQLVDFSLKERNVYKNILDDLESRAKKIDATSLEINQVADLEFLMNAIESNLISYDGLFDYYLPFSHMNSLLDFEIAFQSYQPMETKSDMENYKARLLKFEHAMGTAIEGFKAGVVAGVTLPKESIQLLIQKGDTTLLVSSKDSGYNYKEKAKEIMGNEDFLLEAIEKSVVVGIKNFVEYFKTEYINHARTNPGLFGLPGGEKEYANQIFTHTSLHLTPEEVFQTGLSEIERIFKLMEQTKSEIFDGTMEEFFTALKDKKLYPQLYFDGDDVINSYKDLLDKIDKKTPEFFEKFPKFRQCVIKAIPKTQEKSSPLAFYMPGTAARPGDFYANILLHSTSPATQATALILHEANPGHHHQVSLSLETKEHVIKKMVNVTAFVEGWGLYCEYLGEEMGMYTDKLQYFGRLELEMFRALRLAVDTGIHAKGWSMEEAFQFMRKYSGSSSDDELWSEVKRYAIMPGQAVSYKIGQLKILAIRAHCEKELYELFDLKAFHEALLSFGNMPLSGIEKLMNGWIDEVKMAASNAMMDVSNFLVELQDEFVDIRIKQAPLFGVMVGILKYEDELGDYSLETRDRNVRLFNDLKQKANDVDVSRLSLKEKSDLDFLIDAIDHELISLEGYFYYLPFAHGSNPISLHEYLAKLHPMKTKKDMENLRSRLFKYSLLINSAVDGFKAGIEKGITLPKESVQLIINEAKKSLLFSSKDSPYNFKVKAKEILQDENYLVEAVETSIIPSIQALHDFMENEYLLRARINPGLFGLPDAETVYKNDIFLHTSVRLTPSEVHQLGLAEVDRILKLMEITKTGIFDGTMKEFFAALNDKEKFPQLYYENGEDVIAAYKELIAKIDKKTPEFFEKFPKFKECGVKPVPEAQENSRPLAYYFPGTETKGGEFFANIRLHKESPATMFTALALHEANPGHHHQVSLAYETKEHVIKKMVMVTAFVEGWGLYCEYLGEEMGFYSDKLQYFGRLELEMFRALRLVVDTGLHSKGWSTQKAFEYMKEHVNMTDEILHSEVQRYSTNPGQAVSYKIGQLKILEIRAYAEKELDVWFDLKAFHEALLSFGNMSLSGIERLMKSWVANEKIEFKKNADTHLLGLMDKYVDSSIRNFPLIGGMYGIYRYEDELFDFSHNRRVEVNAASILLKKKALSINISDLSIKGRGDLEFLIAAIDQDLISFGMFSDYMPFNHMFSVVDLHAHFKGFQLMGTKSDFNNLRSRFFKMYDATKTAIDSFKVGIAKGITLPIASVEILIKNAEESLSVTAKTSPFNFPEKAKEITGDEDFLVEAIEKSVFPAFKRFLDFMKTDYLPHARRSPGLFGLPGAEKEYGNEIFLHTTLHLTPDEVHQTGLKEVERIFKLMEVTKTEIFDGTMEEFFAALNNKEKYPQLYFDGDDVIKSYKDLLDKIDERTPEFFEKFPKFRQCVIKAVPKSQEKSSPLAFYMPGTSSRPGEFSANVLLNSTSPATQATALVLHEANPGHHHQVSLSLETEEHVIKKMVNVTAFVEGWGLYCEYLGEEMGMYTDKLQYFGRLELEMFRALRLVVDTGLHSKGWSIDEATAYMKKYSNISDEQAVSEVNRYCAMPGQAVSYKIGQLKILEIRAHAEKELGASFNLKAFHTALLSFGNMPLTGLETLMRKWVSKQ